MKCGGQEINNILDGIKEKDSLLRLSFFVDRMVSGEFDKMNKIGCLLGYG